MLLLLLLDVGLLTDNLDNNCSYTGKKSFFFFFFFVAGAVTDGSDSAGNIEFPRHDCGKCLLFLARAVQFAVRPP